MEKSDGLDQLRKNDPEVALILDIFEEIQRVHDQALLAMGVTSESTLSVVDSSSVTISFHDTISTSVYRPG